MTPFLVLQGLNDAYGKPRYLELNPGMFYPVTYSFLFGIMFGDIGHGSIMLMGALGLIAESGGACLDPEGAPNQFFRVLRGAGVRRYPRLTPRSP